MKKLFSKTNIVTVIALLLIILLGELFGSCVAIHPGAERHHTVLKITTETKDYIECVSDSVDIQWQMRPTKATMPFSLITSRDTIKLDLYQDIMGTTFIQKTKTHRYKVLFYRSHGRSNGYLVKLEEVVLATKASRTMTIGIACKY